jgi:hypothetical protein
MWGAMALNNVYVNEELPHPGVQINEWINDGKYVKAVISKGRYLDIGTVSGLKLLYREDM